MVADWKPNVAAVRRVIVLLFIGALLVGLLDTIQYQLAADVRGSPTPLGAAIGSQFLPWCWLGLLLPLVVMVADRWPVDEGRWRRNLPIHLPAMVAFALIHIAGAIVLVGLFAPSQSQPVNWRMLTLKLLTFRFPIDAMAYWAAVGVAHAARSAATAREREQRAARLEASLVETRLAALRDRLNPHFFFNTLNAVNTLALRRDHEGVIRTIEAMGALLRVTLTERTGQETTLAAELEFLDRYLEIERLRFGDRLTVVRDVDSACLEALLPVMSIQPLAENAIRHGVEVVPGPVEVAVRVYSDRDRLRIQVADTGPGFGPNAGPNGSGIGLASCRDRLQALYGSRARLACSDRPSGGALVELEIPLHFAPAPGST